MTGIPDRPAARIVVVCGPTASGKSELAAAMAEALGGEVIGADSRQVYRHLEIGTAKPSAELRRRVAHHLLDVVDPDQRFDAADWRDLADAAIRNISERGRHAIVCGGTGLYLRSLLRGLVEGPSASAALRSSLEAEERERSGSLHRRLAVVDPAAAQRIHPNDRVRVIRALEVYELTGEALSVRHGRHALGENRYDALVLEVQRPVAELEVRIKERAHAMVDSGLVEEVRRLGQRFDLEAKAFTAIGYREARECVLGRMAHADVAPAVARSTQAYAKRQRTWLRGQMETIAVLPNDLERALEMGRAFLRPVATK